MMNKVIAPGSYVFDAPVVSEIKVSRQGLVGNDLGTFIKRAGYKMADDVRHIKFAAGEVPIHLIVVGATEYYGPNRNGDAFDEDVCKKYHNTFVKHARWYRNHQNKDPNKSYGRIAHSAYNEPMHRIELIAALNGTKEAAEHNRGLVADEELEKLAKHEDIAVSMACKVPFDICSGCGNVAKTRAEYCLGEDEGGHCKEGGCRHRLGQVNENGHHLHVKNTQPDFFDNSKVWRPADYIAYTLGEIKKAAAAGGVTVGGAEIAERLGIVTPFELFLEGVPDRKVRSQMKLARELAKTEERVREDYAGLAKVAGAFTREVQPSPLIYELYSAETKSAALKALAVEKISLPLREFVRLGENNTGRAIKLAEQAARLLPGIYGRMTEDPEGLEADLRAGRYKHDFRNPTKEASVWARELAQHFSLDPRLVERRGWLATVREVEPHISFGDHTTTTKSAADDGEAGRVAREYALYKLAMLDEICDSDPNFMLTCDLAIRQNHTY
jgi:hypothetical protein